MSRRRKRGDALSRIARLEQTEAARRLAVSAAEQEAKNAASEQLKRYLDDYRQLAARGDEAVDGASWANTRLFVERLTGAVDLREQDAAAAQQRYLDDARRFRDAHGRNEAFERLAARDARDALRETGRREQAELDERAARHRK